MKTKLLKKCRKRVRVFERNGTYRICCGGYDLVCSCFESALNFRRDAILFKAKEIFGLKAKREIKFNNLKTNKNYGKRKK